MNADQTPTTICSSDGKMASGAPSTAPMAVEGARSTPENAEAMKPLPQSAIAEQTVIGSLLLDSTKIQTVTLLIGREDFTDPRNSLLFGTIEGMAAQQQPVDIVTVTERLTSTGQLEAAGGAIYLSRLAMDAVTSANCEYFARIVAQRSNQRRLMAAAEELFKQAAAPDVNVLALTQITAELIVKIGNSACSTPPLQLVSAGNWLDVEPPTTDPVIGDVFDRGDKVEIVGSSKSRKTFFVLNMAIALAAGRKSFLDWQIPRALRVLIIQMEVKQAHFHRRVHRMAKRMGITRSDLDNRLMVINGRGRQITPEVILGLVRQYEPEVVIVDPCYKLLEGDANENDGAAWRPILAAFDRIAEETDAAVIYVHHNAKGRAGDRDARDRGAGSGIVARDYDAAIYLTEHKDESDVLVVRTIARNYSEREPFSIRWDDHLFVLADDVAPIEKTSSNSKPKVPVPDDVVIAAVGDGEKPYGELVDAIQHKGYSQAASKEAVTRGQKAGKLQNRREEKFPCRTLYSRSNGMNQPPDQQENA